MREMQPGHEREAVAAVVAEAMQDLQISGRELDPRDSKGGRGGLLSEIQFLHDASAMVMQLQLERAKAQATLRGKGSLCNRGAHRPPQQILAQDGPPARRKPSFVACFVIRRTAGKTSW
jgi:hypothetical protein